MYNEKDWNKVIKTKKYILESIARRLYFELGAPANVRLGRKVTNALAYYAVAATADGNVLYRRCLVFRRNEKGTRLLLN